MAYLDVAYQYARLALFGDSTSTLVATSDLTLLATDAEGTLCQAFPCVTANGSTNNLTNATDVNNFAIALGYQIAGDYLRTTAGLNLLSSKTSVKIGPTEEVRSGRDVQLDQERLYGFANRAMMRITCVSIGIKAESPAPTMFGLGGRRRGITNY